MQFLKIVGMATLAAILYGVIQEEVATRISSLHFTLLHPQLLTANSLTLRALAWGVVSTWWVGLIVGVLLAVAARAGRETRIDSREVVRPIFVLLAIMALGAFLGGYWQFRKGSIVDGNITPSDGARLFAVDMAHGISYIFGFLGGLALCVWALVLRMRRSRSHSVQASGLPISQ